MLPNANQARIEGGPVGGALATGLGAVLTTLGAISVYFVIQAHAEPHGSWIVFAFVLVGLWLLYVGWSTARQQRLIGKLVLRLADVQPRVGGRLRGLIEFDRAPTDREYELLLICERHYRSGKNRHTDRIWEKELRVAPAGNRLAFEFYPSADAPVSEGGSCAWRIVLKSASIQTPLSFDIFLYPVAETNRPGDAADPVSDDGRALRPADIPPQVAVLERGMNRLRIDFAPGRNHQAATVVLIVSTGFGAIAAFLFFQNGVAMLMSLVFGASSVAGLYFGLRLVWQPCSVEIKQGRLHASRAHLFGRVEHSCATTDIERLMATLGYSSNTRAGFQQSYYTLYAITRQGRRIQIGNGIPSSWMAEGLLEHMQAVIGGSVQIVPLEKLADNAIALARTTSK